MIAKKVKLSTGQVPVAFTPYVLGEMFEELNATLKDFNAEYFQSLSFKQMNKIAYWGIVGGIIADTGEEPKGNYFQIVNKHLATFEDVTAVVNMLNDSFASADDDPKPGKGEGKR